MLGCSLHLEDASCVELMYVVNVCVCMCMRVRVCVWCVHNMCVYVISCGLEIL